jgi:hypothetical protein
MLMHAAAAAAAAAAAVAAQNAKAMCREVVRILRTLKAKRDMTVNEARLIVSIEDPRTREQRQLGIEVGGVAATAAAANMFNSITQCCAETCGAA